MPANYKPFDKAEWLRLEKKADELSTTHNPNSYLGRFGSPRRCNEAQWNARLFCTTVS